jgi:hypothetical protein
MKLYFEGAKSLRQFVQAVGTLESTQPGTRQFTFQLDNEQKVPCVLVEGEMSAVEALLGKRIWLRGMGVWLPNRRLERVEVDGLWPSEDESDLWSWLPEPRFPSDLAPEEPSPRPFGLQAIIGKWPGDETDEQIEQALRELS